MLAPGQRIDRYELVCPIGEGGMAHVWAARQKGQHGFERLVALKIIHSRFAEDPAFRTMFLDEARIVGAIQHRNIAQVFDLGESGSLLYMAIEYVDGDSLFMMIAPEHTLPVPIALRIAADACSGLHAVHRLADASGRARNVVHRDISPQNLLISLAGDVKIIDFGIAHARDRAAATTDVGTVKGKVRYMAPEQARREEIGPYTDVFGVGAVLFRTLAGRAPYAAADEIATMQALLANAPPLQALPRGVPPEVARIIRRAIAPEVSERYATTADLQAAIEEVLVNLGGEARSPDVAAWVDTHLSEKARERRRVIAGNAPLPLSRAEEVVRPTVRPALAKPVTAPMPASPAPHLALPGGARARRAPPPNLEPAPPPGFMDVGALMARAGAPPPPRTAPAADVPPDDPRQATGAAAYPIRRDPQPAIVGTRAPVASRRPIKIALAVIGVVALVFGVLLLLPVFVRDRAIASARDAGFAITIDRVGVGFGEVWLRGVTARPVRFTGLVATVQEVHVVGFSAREVRISGVEATLTGDRKSLEVDLGALALESRTHFTGGATSSSPRRVSIVGGRVTWDGVAGEGSHLHLADVGADVVARGSATEELHTSVGRIDLKSPDHELGPWGLSYEEVSATSRLRLILDPPVPDGPSVMLVWGPATPAELTMRIPRSGFDHLGIKPSELGLPVDPKSEVEAKIHGKFPAADRSELTAEGTLFGVRAPPLAGAIDVRIEGTAHGAPGKPLDLDKTSIAFGPFAAAVSGTITRHERGFRLDGVFKALPLTCEKLAKSEAARLGGVAGAVQALGQATGLFRVTGSVNVSGLVKYDTAEPNEASVTFIARETCGVSIFGM